jgi:hypothetical protein
MLRSTYIVSRVAYCIAARRRMYYVRMKWRFLQQISRATTAAPWPFIVPAATRFFAVAATPYQRLDLA